MKILICTNHSYMFWQFRRELTQALLEEHEVILSTPFVGHEDDLAALGCRMMKTAVDRRGINPITDMKLFRFYWKLLEHEKPDLVITYSIKPNIYCGFACRQMHIPYCANVQGLGTAFQKPFLRTVAKWMYKGALKNAKTTIFENVGNAKEFVDRGIQTKEKQTILSGAGVNLDYYAYRPYPQNEKVHFLYLGRIMHEKGMDELFYAVRKLKAEGLDFTLDLVGFYEDEYKSEVDSLVDEGIAVFHGFQSDPRPYYAVADCVVLPSYHEGMSNVLLEAAAIGRPVITSKIHGCMEAVKEGDTGFLVKKQDRESLYWAMKAFLRLPLIKKNAMGRDGRERMEMMFDKKEVVKKTIQIVMENREC